MSALATLDGRGVVEAFQTGDRDAAAAELYRRHRGFVHGFIAKRLNPELAEDLTQEVFLHALSGLDRWQWQGVEPRAWLTAIARNLIADHYRKASRRPALADAPIEDLDLPDPSDTEWTVIGRRAIIAALATLTAEQVEVIQRRYLDDSSVAETAHAMGRDAGAVRSLTFRATRNLAEQLGSYAEAVNRG